MLKSFIFQRSFSQSYIIVFLIGTLIASCECFNPNTPRRKKPATTNPNNEQRRSGIKEKSQQDINNLTNKAAQLTAKLAANYNFSWINNNTSTREKAFFKDINNLANKLAKNYVIDEYNFSPAEKSSLINRLENITKYITYKLLINNFKSISRAEKAKITGIKDIKSKLKDLEYMIVCITKDIKALRLTDEANLQTTLDTINKTYAIPEKLLDLPSNRKRTEQFLVDFLNVMNRAKKYVDDILPVV